MLKQINQFFDELKNVSKKGAKTYLKYFLIVLVVDLLISVVATTVGILLESRGVIVFGFITSLLGIWILFGMLAPIAVPIGAIFGGGNSLEKFMARAMAVCYTKTLVTLGILILLPWISENRAAFPILLVTTIAFYAGGGVISKKVFTPIMVLIFCTTITSLFFPSYFELFTRRVIAFDREVTMNRLTPSLESFDEFPFMDPRKGEFKVFYLNNPTTGKIELYDSCNYHKSYGIKTKRIDYTVKEAYRKQLILDKQQKVEKEVKALEEKKKHQLAISIVDQRGNPIDCEPMLKKLRAKNISFIESSSPELAHYFLKGKVRSSSSSNNVLRENSSFNASVTIDYTLSDSEGKIADSAVSEAVVGLSAESAKSSAMRIVLIKLGNKLKIPSG